MTTILFSDDKRDCRKHFYECNIGINEFTKKNFFHLLKIKLIECFVMKSNIFEIPIRLNNILG